MFSGSTYVCEELMSANNHQVGGTHYAKSVIQPWDYINKNGLGYLEGNIVKYISRWRDKGGVEDLRKVVHYAEKLIEIAMEEKDGI